MMGINYKKIGLYLLFSFGLCWLIGFSYFAFGGLITSTTYMAVAALCMLTPAVAALIVQLGIYKQPLATIGLRFTFNRWLLVAALLPILIALTTIVANWAIPNTSISNGVEAITTQLSASGVVPEAEIATITAQLEGFGRILPLILIGATTISGIIAGFTVNGALALGEELGWRGLLQHELAPLGFWKSSAIVGAFWGFWHLPLILNGHNYPDTPYLGVGMMVIFCVLLSPLHAFITRKAGTVLAAAVMHGVINATAALPLFFVIGGSPLSVGVTGMAGFGVLLVVNGFLWLYLQREGRRGAEQPKVYIDKLSTN